VRLKITLILQRRCHGDVNVTNADCWAVIPHDLETVAKFLKKRRKKERKKETVAK
jgi:hypothetical protein